MSEFDDVLAEIGITEAEINAHNAAYPEADYEMEGLAYIAESHIHGEGLFADTGFAMDWIILPVVYNGGLTPGGAKVNHSKTPNCYLVRYATGDMILIAMRDINAGEELTHDYRRQLWRAERETMNGPQENVGADPSVKFPIPARLQGRYARHVQTREYIYILAVHEDGVIAIKTRGPEKSLHDQVGKPRNLTLTQLARLYNLVPEGRT